MLGSGINWVKSSKTQEFIKKAIKLHKGLYTYSHVIYVSSKKHVKITCKVHGVFEQTPEKHLMGRGCSRCRGRGKTTEDFINEAVAVHGDVYDYKKTEFKKSSTKTQITCRIHGDFYQSPKVHLRGNGCPKCGIEKRTEARRLSKKVLLERFHNRHGQRYDYSEMNYKTIHEPIKIICVEHGHFYQTPQEHFRSNGCVKCFPRTYDHLAKYRSGPLQAKVAKLHSKSEIVEKSKEIHGNKYSYPDLKSAKLNNEITISCPKHGTFTKRLDYHFAGYGCAKCSWESLASSKRMKFDEFLEKANFVHNGFYNYNQVNWLEAKSKIDIICPIHGLFRQNAQSHLQGRKCNECAKKARGLKIRKDVNAIIAEFKSIHGDKYIYDKSSITTSKDYMLITCQKHGDFRQTPSNHRKGRGCPLCKNDKIGDALRASTDDVIAKFQSVHGDEFDYSLVIDNYVNADTPVPIICKEHGVFWQAPYNHIGRGDKCPSCKASKGELAVADWLEKHNFEFISEWKDHDCVSERPLRFDFYIPTENLIIEFDGIQHFERDASWWEKSVKKRQEAFDKLKLHDWLKNEWCKENGYTMVRIRFDEEVDEVLNEWLNSR